MDRVLVFDLWGAYAHYKKIFATTTALTYPIPVKTSIYGLIGAIIGLEKSENAYLRYFQPGSCKIGIQIMKPLAFQRININLRAVFGQMKPTDNRKPTLMEFVYRPRYRIYITHTDSLLLDDLENCLKNKQAVFTPSLGLANLIANFEWVGHFPYNSNSTEKYEPISSVIPRRNLIKLNPELAFQEGNRIIEVSQYALEMDERRNVLDRDDIILDQNGQTINARVSEFCQVTYNNHQYNVVLF